MLAEWREEGLLLEERGAPRKTFTSEQFWYEATGHFLRLVEGLSEEARFSCMD